MLLVTTTMRMVDGVHSNTTHAGVVVLLGVTLPPGSTGLEERLIGTLSTGNDADHSAAATLNGLTDTRGETDTGLRGIVGVTNDNGGGAGGAGETSAVTELSLNIGHDGTFGHCAHGEDVANGKSSFAAAVDKLARVHALDGNEVLSIVLVAVLVPEDNAAKRCTPTRVVKDVLDYALNVTTSRMGVSIRIL